MDQYLDFLDLHRAKSIVLRKNEEVPDHQEQADEKE